MSTGLVLLHSFPSRPQFTDAQKRELDSIIVRLIERVRNHRPLILPHFQDFDRQHRGTVSREQFARVLTLVKSELSGDEMLLLTDKYLDEDISRVDYRRFLYDVDETYAEQAINQTSEAKQLFRYGEQESKEEMIVKSNNTFTPINANNESNNASQRSLDAILTDIRKHSLVQRTAMYDMFNDFDRLRHRTVSRSQFRRCLDVSGFMTTISSADIDVLCDAFASPKKDVLYGEFERAVNGFFIPLDAEQHPTLAHQTHEQARHALVPPAQSIARSTPLDILAQRLAYVTSTRRILLKPAFASYDRHGCGCVSESAFKAVFSSLYHTEAPLLNGPQIDSIVAHFSQGEKGVCYTAFCACIAEREREYEEQLVAIDPVTASQQSIQPNKYATPTQTNNPSVPSLSSTLSQPIRSLPLLMQSLRDTLSYWRMWLDSAFDDFDRLRRGSVSPSVFYRCLSMCGLRMRQEEIAILAQAFACQDEQRQGQVEYKKFLKELSPDLVL